MIWEECKEESSTDYFIFKESSILVCSLISSSILKWGIGVESVCVLVSSYLIYLAAKVLLKLFCFLLNV